MGGHSSIGQLFISQVRSDDFNIYATCSNSELLENKFSMHNWYELNLKSQDSIDLFLLNIQNISFDVIITLIGKTSDLEFNALDTLISNYLETYISRYSYLIREIVKKINASNKRNVVFINISSRSAIYGSLDIFYSMAKSSIHALIKSLSKLYSPRIRFFNLVPGLLKDSNMYFNMHASLRASHELRAGGNLLTAEEFALFLYRFLLDIYNSSNSENGYEVDIKVGPQYK